MNERRSKQELETLSAYLDGELSPAQSQVLEVRLQAEPALQARLENLRKTKLVVDYLLRLRAPHNYTLTPEMISVRSRRKKQPFVGTLRLASALAAILLVVMFGVEFLITSGPLARVQMDAEPMMEAAMVYDEAEPEPLIVWGQPGVGGAEAPVNGMGGDAMIMEEPVMVESMPVEPEVAVEEEIFPEAEPDFLLEAEALPPADDVEVETLRVVPDGEKELPILGINPDQGGEIIQRSGDTIGLQTTQPAWRLVLRVLQIALAAVLLGGGLTWWLLSRRG